LTEAFAGPQNTRAGTPAIDLTPGVQVTLEVRNGDAAVVAAWPTPMTPSKTSNAMAPRQPVPSSCW
jgi:hypothetical protein